MIRPRARGGRRASDRMFFSRIANALASVEGRYEHRHVPRLSALAGISYAVRFVRGAQRSGDNSSADA